MHSPVSKVVDLLSPNLMFRSDADLLLDLVPKDVSESVEIDFSDIQSITGKRSLIRTEKKEFLFSEDSRDQYAGQHQKDDGSGPAQEHLPKV